MDLCVCRDSTLLLSMRSAILNESHDRAVIVLDIPMSIRLGQEQDLDLVSTAAPAEPYHSTEPNRKKREMLSSNIPEEEVFYHKELQSLISRALDEVRQSLQQQWCFPRLLWSREHDNCADKPQQFEAHLAGPGDHLLSFPDSGNQSISVSAQGPPLLLSCHNDFTDLESLHNIVAQNPFASTATVSIGSRTFYIPPKATFLLASIQEGLPALLSAKQIFMRMVSGTTEVERFDFILLDPPWSNRSVRHGKKYRSAEHQQEDPFTQILPFLRDHIASDGTIAVWITNKSSIHASVLYSLQNIGFDVSQEWIWVKTTISGEPVTSLQGLWRKPYERLLLFRRKEVARTSNVARRVIIAVPAEHSQKPCIKAFIEPLLRKDYHALEVFARSLTAGWWSWGNEVLKYQWNSYWVEPGDQPSISESVLR